MVFACQHSTRFRNWQFLIGGNIESEYRDFRCQTPVSYLSSLGGLYNRSLQPTLVFK